MYLRDVVFGGCTRKVNYEYDEGTRLVILSCKPDINAEDHDELAEAVARLHFLDELAYWRPLYEGEKQAGLIPDKDFPKLQRWGYD